MRDRGNLVISNLQQQASYLDDIGAADAYEVAFANAPSTYTAGLQVIFKASNTNTGVSTIDINGLGPIPIKKQVSNDLVAGDIMAGQIIEVIYDGTNFQMTSSINNFSSLFAIGYEITADYFPQIFNAPYGLGLIDMDSAFPQNLTVANDSSVNFPIGTQIIILQGGVGIITIVPDTGVTLQGVSLVTSGQYTALTLIKIANNTWVVLS